MRTQGTYYIRGTEGRKDGKTEGRTEGQKDGRTEGRKAENYVPPLFFEKAGDNNLLVRGNHNHGNIRSIVPAVMCQPYNKVVTVLGVNPRNW